MRHERGLADHLGQKEAVIVELRALAMSQAPKVLLVNDALKQEGTTVRLVQPAHLLPY